MLHRPISAYLLFNYFLYIFFICCVYRERANKFLFMVDCPIGLFIIINLNILYSMQVLQGMSMGCIYRHVAATLQD